MKVVKNLNIKEEPCSDDKDYSFHRCFESFYYKRQGCQYPWNFYDDLNITVCNNLTVLKEMDNTLDPRAKFSNLRRVSFTNGYCPMPCITNRYKLLLQKDEGPGLEDPRMQNTSIKTYSLKIVFDNFVVEQREEFLACDTTCVIGELGGNLGFFLGGSILALFDLFVQCCTKFLKNFNFLNSHREK